MRDIDLSRRTFLKIAGASPLLSLIPSSFTSSNYRQVSSISPVSRSALDLYGGRDAVVDRMNRATRMELKRWEREGRMHGILSRFRGNQLITPDKIYAVMNGEEEVDYLFFQNVGWAKLDMNICGILGEAHFKDAATREHWKSRSGNMSPEGWASIVAVKELYSGCDFFNL